VRGLAMFASVIGGVPAAAFAAALALSDGAPLQSPAAVPSAGSGMPAPAGAGGPPMYGPSLRATPPDIPSGAVVPVAAVDVSPAAGWAPPEAWRLRADRANAAWDRLRARAVAGDRDALLFLSLIKSGDFARPHRPFIP
jgi:hypothetical protein